MSLRTTCPGCRKTYSLNESLRGKTVRCKTCQKTFVVEGEEEILDAVAAEEEPIEAVLVEPASRRAEAKPPRPRNPVPRDDDYGEDDDPRPRRFRRKQNSNTGIIIGAIVGAGVLFLALIVVGLWLIFSSRGSTPPIAQNVPPARLCLTTGICPTSGNFAQRPSAVG
jgi:predicted Zn finger-like uncharacterized protein